MSNTVLTSLSFKAPEESRALFDELLERQKQERPTLTKGAFFEEIINAFANPKTTEKTVDNPEHLERIQFLEKELDERSKECTDWEVRHADFLEKLSRLFHETDYYTEDYIPELIQETQRRALAVPATVEKEVERPLAENEILFSIPEPHLALLRATSNRLNAPMRDILLDMFLRYTVEQWSQWFYPFVIKGDDFKELTRYTQTQLKEWIKRQSK
ncbi:MAG: hypothetical protein LBS07_05460 [Prevotellaceae bacterium]|nr:hypothetical protein [Prevotellaceae bacterium]